MEYKYKINQKVFCGNQKCLIIATKSQPYRPSVDVYHRTEIFPENDYLLFILKDFETEHYFGTLDIFESQIVNLEW